MADKVEEKIFGMLYNGFHPISRSKKKCLELAAQISRLFNEEEIRTARKMCEEIDPLIPDHKYEYWVNEVGRQQKKHAYGHCARCEYQALKSKYEDGT